MERRHQVFVSSTYIDLVAERSEVMQALLELECMPAGMELFPAANDSQWEWIKRVIDESDYYVVIVGGRYGTVSKDSGLSFTEMEYRYAVEKAKPIIAFVCEEISALPSKHVEQQPARAKKLQAFRELVKSRLCKFYSSPADLGAKVSRSLTQLRKQYPSAGWVRADLLEAYPSSDEVLRLKTENEELRAKLEKYGLDAPKALESLASGSEVFEIDFVVSRSVRDEASKRYRSLGDQWEKVQCTWDEIFADLGPTILQNKNDYWTPLRGLNEMIHRKCARELLNKYPGSRLQNFRISSDSADTILLQLRALKLIELDESKSWQLTPYGDNYLVGLLGVRKGKFRAGA